MIDVLNMPAVANDIRLSTLEPIQQLGARLAPILCGELSRLRADAAFALSSGVTLQTVAADGDRIRAEQLSSINSRQVTLDIQAADSSRASRERQDSRGNGGDSGSSGHAESNPDVTHDASKHEALMLGLSQALHSARVAASEEGFSGHPVACVLPLNAMLVAYDDPDAMRCMSRSDDTEDPSDILILCLAFDGSLGESRRVWGFGFQEDQLLGQFEGFWDFQGDHQPASGGQLEDAWQVNVSDVHQDVSVLQCERANGSCRGYRVRSRAGSGEPTQWCWRIGSWTWS